MTYTQKVWLMESKVSEPVVSKGCWHYGEDSENNPNKLDVGVWT